jgi:ATP-binding cassette subfamily B protein
LLIGLSTLITIYIGGKKAILGEITIGNIAEFVMYVNMLTWPVTSIGWVTSVIQKAAASQQRINEFLQVKSEIVNESNDSFQLHGDIEFREVSFQYSQTNIHVLQKVSFTAKAGQTIGITGNTGSGKSTIAALLARVYDVTSGEILIDGKNIKHINLTSFKKQIGYVPQDVFLFSDTIEANISFGLNQKEEKAKIIDAAKMAAVHSNIIEFNFLS